MHFFHRFRSKAALGVAAWNHWSEIIRVFFERAPYHRDSDPFDRALGYLDFRMVQEIYVTNADIREACAAIAAASIEHLRRYIELLFQPAIRKRKSEAS